MTETEQIARRVLQVQGELEFAMDIGNYRQAAVLRRQLQFWKQQQEDERPCHVPAEKQ
jgi:hypothetical protein